MKKYNVDDFFSYHTVLLIAALSSNEFRNITYDLCKNVKIVAQKILIDNDIKK